MVDSDSRDSRRVRSPPDVSRRADQSHEESARMIVAGQTLKMPDAAAATGNTRASKRGATARGEPVSGTARMLSPSGPSGRPATLLPVPAEANKCRGGDERGVHFRTRDAGVEPGNVRRAVVGATEEAIPVAGTPPLTIVGSGGGGHGDNSNQ